MDIFLGRFHPVFVHLPIGFLILAVVLEVLSQVFKKRFQALDSAVAVTLLIGALAALVAVGTGWMLAGTGGYDEATLSWHRWMGVAVVGISFVGFLLKAKILIVPAKVLTFCLAVIFVMVMVTGHLGGNLTHGEDYLTEYAPPIVKKILSTDGDLAEIETIPYQPDSILVFQHLIQPALDRKCISCHNDEKSKGGLNLTNYENLLAGGEEEETLVAWKPRKSSLFHRTTLPMSSSKFMPPKGNPLSYNELKILEWWISEGGVEDMTIASVEVPAEIEYILQQDYQRDVRPQPFYLREKKELLSMDVIHKIEEVGFQVKTLFDGSPYLEVALNKEVEAGGMAALLAAKDHIVKLDLGNTGITDNDLEIIGQFHNLTSLNLSNSKITNAGMVHLKSLARLEILNVYGNPLTDKGMDWLEDISSLKKLYVWNTGLSEEFVQRQRKENPDLIIVGG